MIVLAACAGIADSFFRPAVFAGVPNLVDERGARRRDHAPAGHRVARRRDRPADRRRARQPFRRARRLLDERGDVPLLGAAAPPHSRPPPAERAGNHARPLARPPRGIQRVPSSTALRVALFGFGLTMHRDRARQRQRDLPRDEVARLQPRLRLRIALDRVRYRSRRRQHRRPASCSSGTTCSTSTRSRSSRSPSASSARPCAEHLGCSDRR